MNFLRFQLLRPRALGQVVHSALDTEEVFFVGVLHHRNQQAPVQGHGDADVDVLVKDNIGPVERSVHCRKRAQSGYRGFHEERHKGQLGFVALLKFLFRLGTQHRDFGHVHFIDRIHVRGNALRGHHVLGDSLPHGAHRLDFVIAEVNLLPRHRGFKRHVRLCAGSTRCGRGSRGRHQNGPCRGNRNDRRSSRGSPRGHDDCFDVLLADAPACARPLYRCEVNAVLLGHAADQRRAVDALAGRTRRGNGRSRCHSHGSRGRRPWHWRGRFRRGGRLGFRGSCGRRRGRGSDR